MHPPSRSQHAQSNEMQLLQSPDVLMAERCNNFFLPPIKKGPVPSQNSYGAWTVNWVEMSRQAPLPSATLPALSPAPSSHQHSLTFLKPVHTSSPHSRCLSDIPVVVGSTLSSAPYILHVIGFPCSPWMAD